MDANELQQLQSSPPLLRPLPRRPFQTGASNPSTASSDINGGTRGQSGNTQDVDTKDQAVSRSRSFANLTASTLFGIYAPSSFDTPSQPATPWGTGAETPQQQGGVDGVPSLRSGFRNEELEDKLLRGGGLRTNGFDGRNVTNPSVQRITPQMPKTVVHTVLRNLVRGAVLFTFGTCYGALIAHLHNERNIAPVKLEGLNRESWRYSAFWGAASVAMGFLLPWIDTKFADREVRQQQYHRGTKGTFVSTIQPSGLNAVEWNDVVRSVGAFVGIAYAIRKTPWSSPLQLSATLALVNPFLWYLLDRTSTGLALSVMSGVFATLIIILTNPSWVPSPSLSLLSQRSPATNTTLYQNIQHGDLPVALESIFNHERVGLAIWIGSVFFCSCICFGNIGRLLVPGVTSDRRR